ncbi:hypothetical protein [Methylobacterium fujisawaense]|jgi:hypothetical protein
MFKTAAGVAAAFATFLLVASPATASEGCQPVDALKDPGSLPGKRGWIWADDEVSMRNNRQGVGMAHTWKQIGPERWVIGEEQVPYGEPVEIVKYEEWSGNSGRATVKTDDGRTYVVPGATVKLYEFWKCSVTELLEERRIIDKSGKFPRNVRHKIANTAWVRLVDKSLPVEAHQAWMKPEDVAKIDLMLCRQWMAPDQKQFHGQYPLSCQPFAKNGFEWGVSLDPKAVEVVSPTSMKILLTN